MRGLIHSDGCRVTNWTTRPVGGERKRYEWTRCTRLGNAYDISVARKVSVALMDVHVGPKC